MGSRLRGNDGIASFPWKRESMRRIFYDVLVMVAISMKQPAGIIKNPLEAGFSDAVKPHRKELWWRRRELNPRPQALYRQFYILSTAI
jgi:hypothetical protein